MSLRRHIWPHVAAAMLLMGGATLLLSRQSSLQRLGEPGVKVVSHTIYDPEGQVAGTNSVPLPETLLDFTSEEVPIARVVLDWLPPDTTYAQRLYRSTHETSPFEMLVNVVLMGGDRTSIHKPEYCLVGSGWKNHVYEEDEILIDQPRPYALPVRKVLTSRELPLMDGGTRPMRAVYVYWFVADGQLTARHGERMWSMARNLLFQGVLQRWAYVSAFSICAPGEEEATYQQMKDLIAAMVPSFQKVTGPPLEAAATRTDGIRADADGTGSGYSSGLLAPIDALK